MANEKRGSPEPGGKRRRPATLDLKATEIASEPVKSSEPIETAAETKKPEPQPEATSGAASAPPKSPPGAPSWRPEWADLAVMNERLAGLRRDLAERFDWQLVSAGAVGAAVMFALFLVIYAAGVFNKTDERSVAGATQLADLERQVRDIANRPQPAGLDQRALADLAARIGAAEQAMRRLSDIEARLAKTETAVAAPRAPQIDQALTDRVTALDAAMRPLADIAARLDGVNAAARDAKARADAAFEAAQKNAAAPAADRKEIEALAARIAALEQAAKGAEERLARAAATAGADRAGRLAFVTVALRAAVERGDPFAQELAAARPLVTDAKVLSPLEPFAAAGVPRAAVLARELTQLTGAMLAAAGAAPRDGGFIDRLQSNAERLVRIRPINEAPGDDPATVIARADVKATEGNLAGALADIASLPPAVRAPAQGWVARAQARSAALAAARDLAENAIGALAKSGP